MQSTILLAAAPLAVSAILTRTTKCKRLNSASPYQPPDAAFGVVWTGLYALQGAALAIASAQRDYAGAGAVVLTLALGFLWYGVACRTGLTRATAWLLATNLASAIISMPLLRSRWASAAMAPLVAWLGFALLLHVAQPLPPRPQINATQTPTWQ